jgi:hypothetical protein
MNFSPKKVFIALVATGAVLSGAIVPISAAGAAAPFVVEGVVTVDGAPIAATEVGWFDPATGAGEETVTAADGRYSLPLEAGRAYLLYAGVDHTARGTWKALGGEDYVPMFQGVGKADYLYQSLSVFPAPTTSRSARNIDLDKPGTVSGRVPGLAGHSVKVQSLNGTALRRAITDSDGHYSISGLIPGRYEVYVPATVDKYIAFESDSVSVTAGSTTTVNAKPKKAAAIKGVIRSNGEPLKGIRVTATRGAAIRSDITDSKGRYRIARLPRGKWTVTYNPINARQPVNPWLKKVKKVTVSTGEVRKVNTSLVRGGALHATVIVPTRKTDQVSAVLLNSSGHIVTGADTSRIKDGRATLNLIGIPQGSYTAVFADATTHTFYAKREVTVDNGGSTSLGRVALTRKTVRLVGKVTGTKKATVSFTTDSNFHFISTETKKGKYILRGLVPGIDGTVVVEASRNALKRYDVTAPRSSTNKNFAAGKQSGTISGTFTVGGYPRSAGYVQLVDGTIRHIPGDFVYTGPILAGFATDGGVSTGPSDPGSGRLYAREPAERDNTDFVAKSPFWVTVPGSDKWVTVKSGKNTDLGTVEMTLHR